MHSWCMEMLQREHSSIILFSSYSPEKKIWQGRSSSSLAYFYCLLFFPSSELIYLFFHSDLLQVLSIDRQLRGECLQSWRCLPDQSTTQSTTVLFADPGWGVSWYRGLFQAVRLQYLGVNLGRQILCLLQNYFIND